MKLNSTHSAKNHDSQKTCTFDIIRQA